MFIVNLIGGLGNQMFQYAFGRSLAEQRQVPVAFDTRDLLDRSPKENFTYRDFELHVFEAAVPVASAHDLRPFVAQPTSAPGKLYYRLLRKFKQVQWYTEAQYFVYEPQVWQTSPNTYFNGYWQNEKYFLPHEQVIRRDFTFKSPLTGKNLELARRMQAEESIAVHVRRGDYTSNQLINVAHGTCSPAYYQEAVRLIAEKLANPTLYLFSDEPEWVRQHMTFDYPVTYVSHNSGANSFEDMRLMSLCKHNIIANSSFSWWGAWLNANPEKTVVAPGQWMQIAHVDSSDLIPKEWIRL